VLPCGNCPEGQAQLKQAASVRWGILKQLKLCASGFRRKKRIAKRVICDKKYEEERK
jgi:hypothetical protein